jgi:hypothetical protein
MVTRQGANRQWEETQRHKGTERNPLFFCASFCAGDSPPQPRSRGGCAINKKPRSLRRRRRRGGAGQPPIICWTNTTPSAPSKVASQHWLDVAATPPRLRRGLSFGCGFAALCLCVSVFPTMLSFTAVQRASKKATRSARSALVKTKPKCVS